MTATPEWLAEETVLKFHELQLHEHGGIAGVRDPGLLNSALHCPLTLWAYDRKRADLASLAAAYAAGIAKNHPFLDGNKRTAAVACEAFIELNGCLLSAADEAWYAAIIAIASGEWTEEVLAAWLRDHLVPKAS